MPMAITAENLAEQYGISREDCDRYALKTQTRWGAGEWLHDKLNFSKNYHCTVKLVLGGHSKKTKKLVFNIDYCLMQVKSIAECSKGSILQYFPPSLSYHLPLRPLLCLFFSGR